MNQVRLEILPSEFDLATTITCGQVFSWKEHDGFWIGRDGDHSMRIRQTETGIEGETNLDSEAVAGYFRLDQPCELREAVPSELLKFWDASAGVRMIRPRDPFETFVAFVCSSNNHIVRIGSMVRFLVEQHDGRFPSTYELMEVGEVKLKQNGFGYRSRNLLKATENLVQRGGKEWLESLAKQPAQAATEELESIPFIGPKIAKCIALYGLGHGELVPVDTHIWKLMGETVWPDLQGSPLTKSKMQDVQNWFTDQFGERAGEVQQRLFVGRVLLTIGPAQKFVKRFEGKIHPNDAEPIF